MPIVGVNHHLPILHLSKIMVHMYSTDKTIHQISIGYMINPSLRINNVFRTQVQKFLGYYFSIKKLISIRDCLLKKNIYVMAPIIIYETVGITIRNSYIVFSCVVYTLIDNYVCIYYLPCQSNILRHFKESNI